MKAPTAREAFEIRKAEARQRLQALKATDLADYIPPIPAGITPEALQARQRFALDAEMAQADIDFPPLGQPQTKRGAAGVRLRAHLKAAISDDLLREFARDMLGAQRCSTKYLDALRIVLGNQADAEQRGYKLEMNQRVTFAPARVVRTIIEQMEAAGVTFPQPVGLGAGRRQVVQCFTNSERVQFKGLTPAEELAARDRRQEDADDERRLRFMGPHRPAVRPASITDADVPY